MGFCIGDLVEGYITDIYGKPLMILNNQRSEIHKTDRERMIDNLVVACETFIKYGTANVTNPIFIKDHDFEFNVIVGFHVKYGDRLLSISQMIQPNMSTKQVEEMIKNELLHIQ